MVSLHRPFIHGEGAYALEATGKERKLCPWLSSPMVLVIGKTLLVLADAVKHRFDKSLDGQDAGELALKVESVGLRK